MEILLVLSNYNFNVLNLNLIDLELIDLFN